MSHEKVTASVYQPRFSYKLWILTLSTHEIIFCCKMKTENKSRCYPHSIIRNTHPCWPLMGGKIKVVLICLLLEQQPPFIKFISASFCQHSSNRRLCCQHFYFRKVIRVRVCHTVACLREPQLLKSKSQRRNLRLGLIKRPNGGSWPKRFAHARTETDEEA